MGVVTLIGDGLGWLRKVSCGALKGYSTGDPSLQSYRLFCASVMGKLPVCSAVIRIKLAFSHEDSRANRDDSPFIDILGCEISTVQSALQLAR